VIRVIVAAVMLTACTGSPPAGPSPPGGTPPFSTFQSARFTFRYTTIDAESIAVTAATLDREFQRVGADLALPNGVAVTATLYPNRDAFRAALAPLIGPLPASATGAVSGPDAIHAVSPSVISVWRYETGVEALVHELAHALSLRVNATIGNNPRWLWESVALFEARQIRDPRTLPAFVHPPPPTLAQLSSADNPLVYDVGGLLGEFIVETWGREALVALVRANGNVAQILGLSESEFVGQWVAAVRARYGM
jgi:hypothetical protein